MMELADLNSAQSMAFANKIVGEKSVFYQDAIKVFHTSNLFKYGDINKVSEMGYVQNDSLSKGIYEEYRRGDFALSQNEISEFANCLNSLFKRLQINAGKHNIPIPYLIKDHYSPSYKSCRNEIIQ